jgi:hypothetical protein
MIRITITEVKDPRVRASKAVGVADIEVIDQLGFADIKGCRSYAISVHHRPPDQNRIRWQTTLTGFDPRNVSHWHLIRDALATVLPPKTPNEHTLGVSEPSGSPDIPRPPHGSNQAQCPALPS